MKYLILLAAAMACASCTSTTDSYRVETDLAGRKVLVGKIPRSAIERDSTFTWFPEGYMRYRPEAPALAAVKPQVQNLRFVLFIGTWCSDSKTEVPKLFKYFDELGVSPDRIEMYGLGHDKKSTDDAPERYGVTKVPTVIVYVGQTEIGRIVEQPREGIEEDIRIMLERSH